VLIHVAPRLREVDLGQARVVGPAGGDQHVVDRRRQLGEEPLQALEVRRVEGRAVPRVERAPPAGGAPGCGQ
jgi:hypothetical protein